MSIETLINFITESDRLKAVRRKTLNYHEERYENSAEHSWHLALAAIVFKDYSNENIDILKCIKMAVIHDLVEIDVGDQMIYHQDADKFEKELQAAKRIFGILPDALGREFLNLWREFEKKETPESKYLNSLDRFLPLLSNVLNNGHSWRKYSIFAEQVYNKNKSAISSGSLSIWNKADQLLKECIKKGVLKTLQLSEKAGKKSSTTLTNGAP